MNSIQISPEALNFNKVVTFDSNLNSVTKDDQNFINLFLKFVLILERLCKNEPECTEDIARCFDTSG